MFYREIPDLTCNVTHFSRSVRAEEKRGSFHPKAE